MDELGCRRCTPRPLAPGLPTRPFIDLTSGYVVRSASELPVQGGRPPWRLYQNYPLDLLMLRYGPVDDEMDLAGAPVGPAPVRLRVSADRPSG